MIDVGDLLGGIVKGILWFFGEVFSWWPWGSSSRRQDRARERRERRLRR